MSTTHGLVPAPGSDSTLESAPVDVEKENHASDTASSLGDHQHNGVAPNGDVEKGTTKPDAEAGPAAPATPNFMDPASFPDGGTQAWLCVLGSFCALFVSFGTQRYGVFSGSILTTHRLDKLHWCLPELLPNSPTVQLLTKHCCVDSILGSLSHVPRR